MLTTRLPSHPFVKYSQGAPEVMALIPYGIRYEGRDPSGALGQSRWLGGYGPHTLSHTRLTVIALVLYFNHQNYAI